MSQASDYPITFGYGATDPPYGTVDLPYHRGEDRAMPIGTPVIVNGVTIGQSGSTGFSTGSHLHIGRFIGGKDTPPNGQGFQFNNAVVTEINEDATNGKYVRIQADGASWVYLHMSNNQLVKVGQALEGDNMPSTIGDFEARALIEMGYGYTKELDIESAVPGLVGKESNTIIRQVFASPQYQAYLQYIADLNKAASSPGATTILPPGNYTVKG